MGGTRPTPPSLASVVQTFEAVAGSWGSVSAPAASTVMGGAPERNKNSNLIRAAKLRLLNFLSLFRDLQKPTRFSGGGGSSRIFP